MSDIIKDKVKTTLTIYGLLATLPFFIVKEAVNTIKGNPTTPESLDKQRNDMIEKELAKPCTDAPERLTNEIVKEKVFKQAIRPNGKFDKSYVQKHLIVMLKEYTHPNDRALLETCVRQADGVCEKIIEELQEKNRKVRRDRGDMSAFTDEELLEYVIREGNAKARMNGGNITKIEDLTDQEKKDIVDVFKRMKTEEAQPQAQPQPQQTNGNQDQVNKLNKKMDTLIGIQATSFLLQKDEKGKTRIGKWFDV